MTKTIRIGSKWIKKGKTNRTLVRIGNVLSNVHGRGNTVYFHSDGTGTHHQWAQKHFLEQYKQYRR